MTRPSSSLAKLTRPRLHEAVERDRLFARLDRARTRKSAVCIVGPPGAGKTTVVGTWLDRRDIPGIWYQVDAGDADPATFFYYLGEAGRPFARKDRPALPLLTPEYQHDVAGFSRRFFRELFGWLPDGAAVVLDNYQEVEAQHPFHSLVADAIAEIPADRMLLVVSRRDPPDCYARLVANENVDTVDWDDLKLSLDETKAIARARLPAMGVSEIERLYEQSGGWAAGLTLMLEGYRKSNGVSPGLPTEQETIFAYFAAQIFERLPDATRHFLVATAVLPQVPVSLAEELTGNQQSSEILEDLYKRHLFTHRRPGPEPIYWYHALFRSFLKGKAGGALGLDALHETDRRAARLLDARGSHDEAFQIFHEVQDWPSAQRLIERHAEALLAKGRGQTLRDWIVALPPATLENAPWLRYWLGTSLVPLNQKEARSHLERAFGQFAADGDPMAQALAAAGVIESYFFEWSDFHPMRRWMDTLEPLLDRLSFAGNFRREQKIYTSLLLAILFAAPGHRLLRRTVSRVTEMLDEDMDVNSKASTAMILLSYSNLACDLERARRAVVCIDPLLEHPDLTPINRMWCHIRLGYYHQLIGQYRTALDTLARATGIGEAHGLKGARHTVLLISTYQIPCYAILGDVRSARKCFQRMLEMADPARPMDMSHVSHAKVHVDVAAGNFRMMAEGGAQYSERAASTGMIYVQILRVEHEAMGWAVLGELSRLQEALSRLRRMIAGTCFAFFECEARFLETYAELVHGDFERGRKLLADAIALARETQFQYPQMARYSIVPGVVLAEALRAGIETDYVRDTIRRLHIRPPADAPESWPWPVRILTLGRFEVFCDYQKLEFSGRAPHKVLAVLKAIVVGGGEAVAIAHLTDALWPDEEGDAARKAFDVALVRLRRLLGNAEAVIVRDEQVALNRDVCWVDAWAFARNVEMIERGEGAPQPLLRAGQHALESYRGAFLPADPEDRSIVVMRLKLRDLLARLVSTLGRQLEAAGECEAALACYRRGIDADELAEEFYQGVMRCHAAMGRTAEGMAAFRRLRQTLSVVLGVKPSERSEQLMQLLGSAGRGQSS
jgi:LuxR family transcriptional regulator, maltose regulon positive regulatory protein